MYYDSKSQISVQGVDFNEPLHALLAGFGLYKARQDFDQWSFSVQELHLLCYKRPGPKTFN
jgi:hypothetical protein